MKDFKQERILFISDTHISHRNIIKYCGRPVDADAQMLTAFNPYYSAGIKRIIHIGDFGFFRDRRSALEAYDLMFGGFQGQTEVLLIRGNHDRKYVLKLPWTEIIPEMEQPYYFMWGGLRFKVQHRTFRDIPIRTTVGRWLRQKLADMWLTRADKKLRKRLKGYFFLREPVVSPDVDIAIHGHIHELGQRFVWANNTLIVNGCVEHWDYRPIPIEVIVKEYYARKEYSIRRRNKK